MKRMGFAAALAFACLMTVIPARAAGQEVRGFVVVPAPGRVAGIVVEECPGGVVNGTHWWVFGRSAHHHFSVNATTWGSPFTLKPHHPAANLNIAFGAGGNWIRFSSRALGGEHGIVPSGASEAVVCLAVGAPTRFTYHAG